MSRKLVIVDPNGTRSLDVSGLPLQLGSAYQAEIRISGDVSEPAVALIDLVDERPFRQPAANAPQITVDGEDIAATRWLASGDEIAVRGTCIRCEFDDESLRFTVSHDAVEYETLPPVVGGAGDQSDDADTPITPVRRTSPPAARKREARGHRKAWFIG